MPKRGFTGQIGLRCDEAMTATLKKMEQSHNMPPVDITRGLLKAACAFYESHGWFSFPVSIQPEAFQARYVAEEQADYGRAAAGEVGHVETDSERRVTFADRAFEAMCGYSLQELQGKNLGALLQGVKSERREVARIRKALGARRPITATLTNYRKDGATYQAAMTISPTKSGFTAEVRRVG